jgi:DNA-binding transcriptional LysR family regulator
MYNRLFAEHGLSLDRVRALLEVAASGSIVKAAGGDPVRQSQYSRQIKELEEFFQTRLVERHGKGIRLTPGGRELARISRFFLLGLSNFQRGCLAEEQTFRIGASATFTETFLLPVLTRNLSPGLQYAVEVVPNDDSERRLHDLTLDFAVVTSTSLSRPLQLTELGRCAVNWWVPKRLCKTRKEALRAFETKQLPLIIPRREIEGMLSSAPIPHPQITCDTFLQARAVLEEQRLSTFLPDFLRVENSAAFLRLAVPSYEPLDFRYRLAWNPRLLRLNAHAARRRDSLVGALREELKRAGAQVRA